jgi:hypothetical protein
MQVFRLIFAADLLLDKKRIPEKAKELATLAVGKDEAGLKTANPSASILADELYEARQTAASRDEYLPAPVVPERTLGALIRGRIEELNGRALLSTNEPDKAVVRLQRATSVLPVDSAAWRSSMWRLGEALVQSGNDEEALETFIACYKSDYPNSDRYVAIEEIYRRVKGSIAGLEAAIGANPAPVAVSKNETDTSLNGAELTQPDTTPSASSSPEATLAVAAAEQLPAAGEQSQRTPDAPIAVPAKDPLEEAKITTAKESETPTKPEATPARSAVDGKDGSDKPAAKKGISNLSTSTTDLFPPVVIRVAERPRLAPNQKQDVTETKVENPVVDGGVAEIAGTNETETKKSVDPSVVCSVVLSEESLTWTKNGGALAVIVRMADDSDVTGLSVRSENPDDIAARLEPISGITDKGLYIISSISSNTGTFKVTFELPCGKKELVVTVR